MKMAESGDDGISALIAEFVECTDASVDVAKELLEKSSGNLEVRKWPKMPCWIYIAGHYKRVRACN